MDFDDSADYEVSYLRGVARPEGSYGEELVGAGECAGEGGSDVCAGGGDICPVTSFYNVSRTVKKYLCVDGLMMCDLPHPLGVGSDDGARREDVVPGSLVLDLDAGSATFAGSHGYVALHVYAAI